MAEAAIDHQQARESLPASAHRVRSGSREIVSPDPIVHPVSSGAAGEPIPVGWEDELVCRFDRRVRFLVAQRVHPDSIDDVVNEVLAAVVLAVRERRVREPDRLGAFVHGVTRNAISNWARAAARARRDWEIETLAPPETPDPLRLLLDSETRTAVRSCLEELREEDRRVLRLAYWQGLTPAEVAEELDIAANVARQRLWRARERFKEKWRGSDAV